jgi:hypothetical protein
VKYLRRIRVVGVSFAAGAPPATHVWIIQGRLEFDDGRLVSALARQDLGRLS